MISSDLYRKSVSLFGATILFALLGSNNATAATPICDLRGPGPAYECRAMIDKMLNDDRIVSTVSEPQEDSSISVKAPRAVSGDNSGVHISKTGLGALYQALSHPSGAWKIVLPVQPDEVG